MINKRLLWVGTLIAAWQFLGGSKISERMDVTARAETTVAAQRENRRIFKYSVIPGGVYSGEELSRSRRLDPVVAAHYADFDVNAARIVQLSQSQLVYVSYRKADKVFWTKAKHKVPAGEAVVTDGKNTARSRCGNRLSKTPHLPIAKSEPVEAALGAPTPTPNYVAGPPESPSLTGPIAEPAANSGAGPVEAAMPRSVTGASNDLPRPSAVYPWLAPVFAAGPSTAGSPGVGGNPAPGTAGGTNGPGSGGPGTGGGTNNPGGGTGGTITPITAIPEPGTILMLFAGGLTIYGLRARRSRQ